MESECYPSSIMPHSSRLFLDYVESAKPLAPFFSTTAAGTSWMSQGRELSVEHRTRLADLLAEQNAAFGGGDVTARNIERLRNGASVVVSGQQVALFGGPLYTFLKAATAIARAREATEAGFDTVPVFWLASEDHDFAEVAQVNLPARGWAEDGDARRGPGGSGSRGRDQARERAQERRWLSWRHCWVRVRRRLCCVSFTGRRRRWPALSEA